MSGRAAGGTLGLLLLAGGAQAGEGGGRALPYSLWCGGKAADLATTEWVLARGGSESNELMRERGTRIGAGVVTCVAAAEVDHAMRRKPKLRWGLRVLGLGLMAYAVQHNAREAGRAPGRK